MDPIAHISEDPIYGDEAAHYSIIGCNCDHSRCNCVRKGVMAIANVSIGCDARAGEFITASGANRRKSTAMVETIKRPKPAPKSKGKGK